MLTIFKITLILEVFWFFFFQAEDGIRDADVTGVQTCALPICEHQGFSVDTRRDLGDCEKGPNSVALSLTVVDAIDHDLSCHSCRCVTELPMALAVPPVVPARIARVLHPILHSPQISGVDSPPFCSREVQARLVDYSNSVHSRPSSMRLSSPPSHQRAVQQRCNNAPTAFHRLDRRHPSCRASSAVA